MYEAEDQGSEANRQARIQRAGIAPGNGARNRLEDSTPIFGMQIQAMMELQNRIHSMTNRVRTAVDLITGEQPSSVDEAKVAPNPSTIEQAWRGLTLATEALNYQIDRLYVRS